MCLMCVGGYVVCHVCGYVMCVSVDMLHVVRLCGGMLRVMCVCDHVMCRVYLCVGMLYVMCLCVGMLCVMCVLWGYVMCHVCWWRICYV